MSVNDSLNKKKFTSKDFIKTNNNSNNTINNDKINNNNIFNFKNKNTELYYLVKTKINDLLGFITSFLIFGYILMVILNKYYDEIFLYFALAFTLLLNIYFLLKTFSFITIFHNFKMFKKYLKDNNIEFKIESNNKSLLFKYIKNKKEKIFISPFIEIIKGNNFYMEYIETFKYKYYYNNEGKRKKEKVPYFIGYIIKYKLDKNYNVNIIIKKDSFFIYDPIFLDKKIARVKLDNPMFEKYFDIFSNEQINSRVYFNQKRMMNFIDLISKNDLKFMKLGGIKIIDDYSILVSNKKKIYISEDIKNFFFNRQIYNEKLINKFEKFFNLIDKFYIVLK